MIGPGTMPVRVEVLDTAPVMVASRRAARAERPRDRGATVATRVAAPASEPAREPAPARAHGAFAVLVATLSDAGKAEHLRSRIALKFPDAHVSPIDVGADRYYRVRIGPYPERPHAVARAELVNRFGYPAVITEDAGP
jgi:cell division septation protein DedD